MRPDDVREFVQSKPFHPFRITLTDGRTLDVHHPELIMIGRATVSIGTPWPGMTEPIYDRVVVVSLLHIMHIEPLEKHAPPSVSSN